MKTIWHKNQVTFTYCHEDDLLEISHMLKKESVCKYLFFGPNTKETTYAYFSPLIKDIQRCLKENKLPNVHVFVMRESQTKKFIGQCALIPIDFCTGNYLIGYQLDDTQWKKGYGTLALEFLIQYAFHDLGAHRLTGDCAEGNLGSEKIMRKLNFEFEGRQKNYFNTSNGYVHRILFGLLKENLSKEDLNTLRFSFE